MKLKSLVWVATAFGVLAIIDVFWLWSLPDSLPTTSVDHRRRYFLLCILLGVMFLLQGSALLNSAEIRSRHLAGKVTIGVGIACVLAGIRIAYVHMANN